MFYQKCSFSGNSFHPKNNTEAHFNKKTLHTRFEGVFVSFSFLQSLQAFGNESQFTKLIFIFSLSEVFQLFRLSREQIFICKSKLNFLEGFEIHNLKCSFLEKSGDFLICNQFEFNKQLMHQQCYTSVRFRWIRLQIIYNL